MLGELAALGAAMGAASRAVEGISAGSALIATAVKKEYDRFVCRRYSSAEKRRYREYRLLWPSLPELDAELEAPPSMPDVVNTLAAHTWSASDCPRSLAPELRRLGLAASAICRRCLARERQLAREVPTPEAFIIGELVRWCASISPAAPVADIEAQIAHNLRALLSARACMRADGLADAVMADTDSLIVAMREFERGVGEKLPSVRASQLLPTIRGELNAARTALGVALFSAATVSRAVSAPMPLHELRAELATLGAEDAWHAVLRALLDESSAEPWPPLRDAALAAARALDETSAEGGGVPAGELAELVGRALHADGPAEQEAARALAATLSAVLTAVREVARAFEACEIVREQPPACAPPRLPALPQLEATRLPTLAGGGSEADRTRTRGDEPRAAPSTLACVLQQLNALHAAVRVLKREVHALLLALDHASLAPATSAAPAHSTAQGVPGPSRWWHWAVPARLLGAINTRASNAVADTWRANRDAAAESFQVALCSLEQVATRCQQAAAWAGMPALELHAAMSVRAAPRSPMADGVARHGTDAALPARQGYLAAALDDGDRSAPMEELQQPPRLGGAGRKRDASEMLSGENDDYNIRHAPWVLGAATSGSAVPTSRHGLDAGAVDTRPANGVASVPASGITEEDIAPPPAEQATESSPALLPPASSGANKRLRVAQQ